MRTSVIVGIVFAALAALAAISVGSIYAVCRYHVFRASQERGMEHLLTPAGRRKLQQSPPLRRKLMLTYKELPQPHVMDRFRSDVFDVVFYDNSACENYMKTYTVTSVYEKYMAIERGAHAADFFRFVWMYLEGGVYLDIKTIPLVPLDSLLFPEGELVVCRYSKILHIGVLGPKGHIFFERMVTFINALPTWIYKFKREYHVNCKRAMEVLQTEALRDSSTVWVETCSDSVCREYHLQRDRYGNCCYIQDENGKVVMLSRDHTFPWL